MKLKIIDEDTKEKVEEEFNKIHDRVKFSQSHVIPALKGTDAGLEQTNNYVIFCLLEDERYIQ